MYVYVCSYIYYFFIFITKYKKIYSLPERFRLAKVVMGKSPGPHRMSVRMYGAVGGKWEKRFGNGNV